MVVKVGGITKDGKIFCNYHVVGKLHKCILFKPARKMPKCSICFKTLSPRGAIDPDYISHSNVIGSRLNKTGPILPPG